MGRHRGKPKSVTSFSYSDDEEEMIRQANIIAIRERTTFSQLIVKVLSEYVKVHGEGNPNYQIKQWVPNPDLRCVPAFYATRKQWTSFLNNENSRRELEKGEDHAKFLHNIWADRMHKSKIGT